MNQQLNNQPKMPEKKNGSSGIIIAVVLVVLFVIGLSVWSGRTPTNTTHTTTTIPQKQTSTSIPESKPEVVSDFDLSIKSVSVKKAGSQYSYYFSIRNKESKDFKGTITISLLDNKGNVVSDPEVLNRAFGELYSENDNDVIYFNRNVNPSTIVKFRYSVTMNGAVVESGEDVIEQ